MAMETSYIDTYRGTGCTTIGTDWYCGNFTYRYISKTNTVYNVFGILRLSCLGIISLGMIVYPIRTEFRKEEK
jgi:hypothetical protein